MFDMTFYSPALRFLSNRTTLVFVQVPEMKRTGRLKGS